MRIVSLLPSITEVCFALGLDEELAAVTHECDYPPAARLKPAATRNVLPAGITDGAEIDRLVTERVIDGLPIYELDVALLESIQPDLILTQQLCDVCAVSYEDVLAVAERLSKRPDVVSIEPSGIDEVLASIRTVGDLTGRQTEADRVLGVLRHRMDTVREGVRRGGKPASSVVCLEWLDPPMVGGHWVPEMVALAGGRDRLGTAGQPSTYIEWQQVLAAEPEVLVLMPCGYDLPATVREAAHLAERPGLDEMPAVQNGRVYAVDGSGYFNRPGPRLIGGLEILAELLHPDIFAGQAPAGTFQPVELRQAGALR